MNSQTNPDDSLIFDLISISILGDQVSCVDLWFIVEVSHNRNHIGDVEHLYVILVGWDHDPDVSFGRFYEVVLLKTQQVLTCDCFSQIDLEVILTNFDGVLVISPYLSIGPLHLQYNASFSLLTPRYHLHPLRLLEPLAQVIDGFLDELSKHFSVFAFHNSCTLFYFGDNTITSSQFSSNDFSFLSFDEFDGEVEVISVLLIHDLINIAVLGKGLNLDGQ